MAIESERGCGYRKVGGIYFVGSGMTVQCDRLNYNLTLCPTCNSGIKFTRGYQWIDWFAYAGKHEGCHGDFENCPLCNPPEGRNYGLMWVGDKYYSPATFIREGNSMGISKRIYSVPKKFVVGEDWILLAHKKAGENDGQGHPTPAIFHAFQPQRIEMLLFTSDATEEMLEKLARRGITPVLVPDTDTDHKRVGYKLPKVKDEQGKKPSEEVRRLDNYDSREEVRGEGGETSE